MRLKLVPALIAIGVALAIAKTAAVAADPAEEADGQQKNAAASAKDAPPAEAATAPAETPATETAAPAADPAEAARQNFAAQAGLSFEEVRVLQALGERRKMLDARAAELDVREQAVLAAEKRLDTRLAELKAVETRINQAIGVLDEQRNQQIASLVRVYENMKPKDAARIFDALETDLLVDVAGRLKPAVLAPIMAEMSSDRARTLTSLLARRDDRLNPDALAAATQGR